MRLTDISLNDLRRRKSKMAFLVVGLLVGVATVVTLVSITQAMHADIQDKIDQFGANILITPKSDELSLSYGGVTVSNTSFDIKELHSNDAATIRTIDLRANLATVAPKLIGAVDTSAGKALLVGVVFTEELKIKKWWRIVGAEPATDTDILLGYRAAAKLGAMPGNSLQIGGKTLKVVGTLEETGGQEDSLIVSDLATAQAILDKPNAISLIEISALCKACPVEEIVKQIEGVLPNAKVTALSQAVRGRQQTVDQLTSFSVAVSAVVLLIGALVVLTTMMSSVNERTREIGIFRAIGFRRSHVARVILTEAFVVSLLGGVLGWLIGMLASQALGPAVAQLTVPVKWDPILAGGAVGLSIAVGMAASAYPAMRAANLDPAEALRFI